MEKIRIKQVLVLVFSIFCATTYLFSNNQDDLKVVISDDHYELVLMLKDDELVLVSTKMDYMDEFETYQKKVEIMSKDTNDLKAVLPKETQLLSMEDTITFSEQILNYNEDQLDNINQALGFIFSEYSDKEVQVNNDINNELKLNKYLGMVNLFSNIDNQMYKANMVMVFNEKDNFLYPHVIRSKQSETLEVIELYYSNYYSAINDSLSLENLQITVDNEKLKVNVDSDILDSNNNLDIDKIDSLLFSLKYNTDYTDVDVYIKNVFIKSINLESLIINKI